MPKALHTSLQNQMVFIRYLNKGLQNDSSRVIQGSTRLEEEVASLNSAQCKGLAGVGTCKKIGSRVAGCRVANCLVNFSSTEVAVACGLGTCFHLKSACALACFPSWDEGDRDEEGNYSLILGEVLAKDHTSHQGALGCRTWALLALDLKYPFLSSTFLLQEA